ncbi:hypothetical protein Tsubulata_036281, partial [Turnera subulata]
FKRNILSSLAVLLDPHSMEARNCIFQIITLTFIFLSTAHSTIFNFPAAFNFGDSNSDTGNFIAAGLDRLNPPYGQIYFHQPSGRFCDGRLIIDFLSKSPSIMRPFVPKMDAMDLPHLNAYLDAINKPSFRTGCNFAVAASKILPPTATSISPFSFGVQVNQFLRFKSLVLQVVAKEFEAGLKKLYDEGAMNFWIHNTGPLGCLTENVAKFGTDSSKLDEHGCVRGHNEAAKLFNLQLHVLTKKLKSQLSDSNITYVDIYTIKSNLIANYSLYGFEQSIMACCGYGGPPLNYDTRVSCGKTSVLNGTVTALGCSDSTKYVNWDGIHYTEAANHYVASQILSGKHSDPPFGRLNSFSVWQIKFLLCYKIYYC